MTDRIEISDIAPDAFARFQAGQRTARRQQVRALLTIVQLPKLDARAARRFRQLLVDVGAGAHDAVHGAVYQTQVFDSATVPQPPLRLSIAQARGIHRDLRDAFDALFQPSSGQYRTWVIPARPTRCLLVHGGPWIQRVDLADGIAQVWFAIAGLLAEFGSEIHRCPECQTLFHVERQAGRRRRYCSRRCATRDRFRKWYGEHRDVVLERRHQAYVRRQRQKQPRVKVQRRRRAHATKGRTQ